MTALNPHTAADLARGVYGILDDNNVERAMVSRGATGLGNHFDLGQATIAEGTSGLGKSKKDSNFAVVLPGTGSRQGEYAVVTRGTATKHDWLSNINAAWTSGPAGHTVHSGFKQVFESLEGTVETTLRGKNPTLIHCVGHSLGGALANLFAAKLNDQGHGVSLYTFGSPRVGMQGMSEYLENEINTDIYRVYNPSDPVPLVPTYPYMHSPASRGGLRVTGASSHLFSIDSHSMRTYTRAVKDESWGSLASSPSPLPLHASIDQWLDKAADHVSFPGSSIAMSFLGKALKVILDAARATIGLTYTIGAALTDLIAMLLKKAYDFSKSLAKQVLRWISLVMKFAGKTIVATKDITQAFLRWVLDLLMRPLIAIAGRAIHFGTQAFS